MCVNVYCIPWGENFVDFADFKAVKYSQTKISKAA